MSKIDKIKGWILNSENSDDLDEVEEESYAEETTGSNNNQRGVTSNAKIILFEPRAYSESQDIADFLIQKKAALVNLHRLQKDQSTKVVDFLNGVIYAINGDIQKVDTDILLCTPKNIGVTGTIEIDK